MTKSIKLIAVLSLILFIAPFGIAQNNNSHHNNNCSTISRNIQLDGSSKIEEIKLDVAEDISCLQIAVNSTIKSGSLTMEIFDPKGDKQGNFSVESQINSSSSSNAKELVCGQLNKTIKEPMKGKWIIKLKPKNVTGDITIHSNQLNQSNSSH